MVLPLLGGQQLPQRLNDRERFGPSHMAVPSNDIESHESALGQEAVPDALEEKLEGLNMVQRVMNQDPRIFFGGLPTVDIGLNEVESVKNPSLARLLASTLDLGCGNFHRVDDSILKVSRAKFLHKSRFNSAVTKSHAQ